MTRIDDLTFDVKNLAIDRVELKHRRVPLSPYDMGLGGQHELTIIMTVRDRDTGERTFTLRTVRLHAHLDRAQLARRVRTEIKLALEHELDEQLLVNGLRHFDPHEPDRDAQLARLRASDIPHVDDDNPLIPAPHINLGVDLGAQPALLFLHVVRIDGAGPAEPASNEFRSTTFGADASHSPKSAPLTKFEGEKVCEPTKFAPEIAGRFQQTPHKLTFKLRRRVERVVDALHVTCACGAGLELDVGLRHGVIPGPISTVTRACAVVAPDEHARLVEFCIAHLAIDEVPTP
jgi:hypothetical protein